MHDLRDHDERTLLPILLAFGHVEPGTARTFGRHLAGVRWWTLLGDLSGYGNESRLLLSGLQDRGVPIQTRNLPGTFSLRHPILDGKERARERINDPISPDHLAIVHHTSPCVVSPRGGHMVLRTMFETDRLPASWLQDLRLFDEVWVPSEHLRRIFIDAGVRESRVAVLPEPIDVALFSPDSHQPMVGLPRAGFRFLAVGDWSIRKGWDILIRAYLQEFTPADDALLVIHTRRTFRPATIRRDLDRIRSQVPFPRQHPPIYLSLKALPTARMPTLYRACNAFVLASRGEGWGRPYMEAMAMGLPTIGTNWGGNRAFMDEDNSYLVECELRPVDSAAVRQFAPAAGHCWAAPSNEHLRHVMRSVASDSAEGQARGRRARRDIADNYSVSQIVGSLLA